MADTPENAAPSGASAAQPVPNVVRAPTEEKLIWEGSPKWQADFGFLFLSVLVAMGGLASFVWLIGKFPYSWTVGLALVLLGAGMFVGVRLKRRFQRFKLTNLVVEFQHGVLSTHIENMELWRINDVGYHQGLVDKILGVATIHLETQDKSDPHLNIIGLPSGRQVFDELKRSIHIARQARNVLGMVE